MLSVPADVADAGAVLALAVEGAARVAGLGLALRTVPSNLALAFAVDAFPVRPAVCSAVH